MMLCDGSRTVMINGLLVCIITLAVLMSCVLSDDQDPEEIMTVCQEEDGDLRVDCHMKPKPNYIAEYQFSMSQWGKETIINTNVSGSSSEAKFKHNTYVKDLDPYGFRLTMMVYTLAENTTFICTVTKEMHTLFVEKDTVLPCSAISVFLQSYTWLLGLLISFWNVQL